MYNTHRYDHSVKLYGADAYHRMKYGLLKQSSELTIDLNEEDWYEIPDDLDLIRISDCIAHADDKVLLFGKCYE